MPVLERDMAADAMSRTSGKSVTRSQELHALFVNRTSEPGMPQYGKGITAGQSQIRRTERSVKGLIWSSQLSQTYGQIVVDIALVYFGTRLAQRSEGLIGETPNWVKYLAEDDQAAMRAELDALLHTAVTTGEWRPYHDALQAWHSTADILSDPDLVAELNEPWDPAEEVLLRRP